MNILTLTSNQLASLTWNQTIKLGKETIIAILDELTIDYVENENYFRLCSKVYHHFKQQPQQPLETTSEEVNEDVEVIDTEKHSFRELQLRAIGKLHRTVTPITPKPKPKLPRRLKVLRTHSNGSRYYSMHVVRCLVQDPLTQEKWWTGSNKLDGIKPGDIVVECIGTTGSVLDWVVPLKRPAKV